MCFDSLGGRKAAHTRGPRSCTRADAGTGGARGFRAVLGAYEAFDCRAHRCKSCATQTNLFGAALTVLRQGKGDRAERPWSQAVIATPHPVPDMVISISAFV